MKDIVCIKPAKLQGKIACTSSKSVSHRMAICAILAGQSIVNGLGQFKDIQVTLEAMHALGFEDFSCQDGRLISSSNQRIDKEQIVDCYESGTTIRLLLPLAMNGTHYVFSGQLRLMERPMSVYEKICKEQGIRFEKMDGEFHVQGALKSGRFEVPGDISSQFISGMLLALPRLEGDSIIEITTPLESRPYVELTIQTMNLFDIQVKWENDHTILIPGGQKYKPATLQVEGDYSHAAFWFAAGVLGGQTIVTNLNPNSIQGDRKVIDVLRKMGAKIEWKDEGYICCSSKLIAQTIDVSQIPDLVPILAVVACFAEGTTKIINAKRLRIKESDRLAAMTKELRKLGAKIEEFEDMLLIEGNPDQKFRGCLCNGHNDHRVVMSLAIASMHCEGELRISDAHATSKSVPDFWSEFSSMNGQCHFEEQ